MNTTYYYRVKTIDAGLKESAWSATGVCIRWWQVPSHRRCWTWWRDREKDKYY
jgi:hypothetical protein